MTLSRSTPLRRTGPPKRRTPLRGVGRKDGSTTTQRRQHVEAGYERLMQLTRAEGDCVVFTGTERFKGERWDWYAKLVVVPGEEKWFGHRLSYEFNHGPIPDGQVVRHDCDNPPCVNIAHLRLGTQAQNMADARRRGRWVPTRGDRNNRSTMTPDGVREIRALRDAGWNYRQIAEHVGISHRSACAIGAGERWGWVE